MTKTEDTEFILEIKKDLKQGFGKFLICTGKPGTGKSYACLRLGEMIDPSFGADKVVIGDALAFINLLEKALQGEFEKGSFLMFDEAGMGLSSRDWNKKQNKITAVVLQLIRKMGLFIAFTLPNLGMIDVTARKVTSFWMRAERLNLITKRSYFKIWRLDYNDFIDKLYRHNIKEGGKDITLWEFTLPQKINLNEYERIKTEGLMKSLNDAKRSFGEHEPRKVGRPRKGEERQEEIIELLEEGRDGAEIADMVGVTVQNVAYTKRRYEIE